MRGPAGDTAAVVGPTSGIDSRAYVVHTEDMSRQATWVCDGCGAREDDDGWQAEGWIHTMDGRDLCLECVNANA
jgi:hypothetical protein